MNIAMPYEPNRVNKPCDYEAKDQEIGYEEALSNNYDSLPQVRQMES